ncbi:MAG: alpha/beta fold hydrolase [Betaproteobacteria bacterium]|nr:alpha/beta fold hydrolase [Betaproteobacteria bacterium]
MADLRARMRPIGVRALTALLVAAAAAAMLPAVASATIVESVIEVPVRVTGARGQRVEQTIKVTIFRDDRLGRAPYLVLHHGRPVSLEDLPAMGRARYPENARYFVRQGFVVLVPTRVGYGESGGPDVENSGRCEDRQFRPAYAASADQTEAVLRAAADLPFVDPGRGIVVGQSFGGMTALAVAARQHPGLVAAINFAGGGGGNPRERPAQPCSQARLAGLFAEYGAQAAVPSLWLYSENDRYWGPHLPRQWFERYVAAGAAAEFIALPPHGEDGHGIFSGNPAAWRPSVEAFLRRLGFTPPPR